MDSLTHFAAGALVPLAFRHAPKRAALVFFGIAAGEFPDIDVFLVGRDPIAMMTIHRGITHAILMQPVWAFILTFVFFIFFLKKQKEVPLPASFPPPSFSDTGCTKPAVKVPGLVSLFCMALVALLLHVYLDSMTTFGTQIFLPFSSERVAIASMFIIDPFITVPACVLLFLSLRQKGIYEQLKQGTYVYFFSERSRKYAIIGLVWIVFYPLINLTVNGLYTYICAEKFHTSTQKIHLFTEPFTPFVWKVVVLPDKAKMSRMNEAQESGSLPVPFVAVENNPFDPPKYQVGTLFLWSGVNDIQFESLPVADKQMMASLGEQREIFRHFALFSPVLVQEERAIPPEFQPIDDAACYAFYDVRYRISPESPARKVGYTATNFVLEAVVNKQTGTLVAFRFLDRSTKTDTPWQQ